MLPSAPAISIPAIFYIAQMYNCDAYGMGNYNECPVTPDPDPGPGPGPNPSPTPTPNPGASGGGGGYVTADGDDSPEGSDGTLTPIYPEDDETDPGYWTGTGNTNGNTQGPIETVADTSWSIIIPIALILAVLAALIILLIKRRKRNSATNYTPPQPPIAPSGPTNPFSGGQ